MARAATASQGPPREFGREHPARPILVVEVALSSVTLDRDHKGSLYARAQLQDYWIVNLVDRVLGSGQTLGPEAAVAPLAAPAARVSVADLLP